MAENTVLNIDFGDTLQRLAAIKTETAALQAANKNLELAITGNEQALKAYGGTAAQAAAQLVKNETVVRSLTIEQKALTTVVDEAVEVSNRNSKALAAVVAEQESLKAEFMSGKKEYGEIATRLRELNERHDELKRSSGEVRTAITAQTGSIEANRAQLERMKKDYQALANPTEEQAERIKELTQTIKDQEEALGEDSAWTDYLDVVDETIGKVKVFGVSVSDMVGGVKTAADVMKTAGVSVRGFSAALAATGLGLVIVAVQLLVENFEKVKKVVTENIMALAAISPPIAAIVKGIQLLQQNIDSVKQYFVGFGKVAQTVLSSVAGAITSVFQGKFAEAKKQFEGFGAKLQSAFEEGRRQEQDRQIKETTNQILQAEIDKNKQLLKIMEAKGEDTFAKQREIMEDELKLLDKASVEFYEKEKELRDLINKRRKEDQDKANKQTEDALNKKLKIHEDNLKQQELAELKKLSSGETKRWEYEQNIAKIREEGLQEEIKIMEEFKKDTIDLQIELENTILEQRERSQEKLSELDLTANIKIQIEEIKEKTKQLEAAGATELQIKEYTAKEMKRIEQEQSDIVLEELQKRTQGIHKSNAQEIISIKQKYDELIAKAGNNKKEIADLEKKKQEEVLMAQRTGLQKQLEELQKQLAEATNLSEDSDLGDKILSDEDKEKINAGVAEVTNAIGQINIALNNVGTSAETGDKTDLLGMMGIDEDKFNAAMDVATSFTDSLSEIFTNISEKRINELEAERARELELAQGNTAKMEEINAKYDEKVNKQKKKAFEQQKKFQIASTIIETAKGVVSAFSTGMQFGAPAGPIIAGILSALAVVTGATQIAMIKSQNFAKGGEVPLTVGGNPHSQGGTTFVGEDGNMFEVERGEKIFVLKKNASEFIDRYSTLNQMFGGRSWTGKPIAHAALGGNIASSFDGGMAARNSRDNVQQQISLADILSNMPAPVVRVTEINRVQRSTEQTVAVSEL